jgi:phosphate transport system protein
MRKNFESEIMNLKDDLLVLGSMVEEQVLGAVEALRVRDIESARQLFEKDEAINARRYAIEEQVMVTIATQQPMAHDIRLLASVMEVAGELERMGDYAKGIATINIRMGEEPLLKPLVDIPRMARKGVDMLHRALLAFATEDVSLASSIPVEDDEVDRLYGLVYRDLMAIIVADPRTIERANQMLWVAHNLERLADRVTNICERTLFTATGELHEIPSTHQD